MKRAKLKQCAEAIGQEVQGWGYDFWAANRSPVTFDRKMFGEDLQVEAQALGRGKDYVQVGISVDDGRWFNATLPPSTSIIIKKSGDPQNP